MIKEVCVPVCVCVCVWVCVLLWNTEAWVVLRCSQQSTYKPLVLLPPWLVVKSNSNFLRSRDYANLEFVLRSCHRLSLSVTHSSSLLLPYTCRHIAHKHPEVRTDSWSVGHADLWVTQVTWCCICVWLKCFPSFRAWSVQLWSKCFQWDYSKWRESRNIPKNLWFSFAAILNYSLMCPYSSTAAGRDFIHRYFAHFGWQNVD